MQWNDHSKLEGTHAFLGASNYHWINWSDDIFEQRYFSQYAVQIGTIIHNLAKDCIRKRMRIHNRDRHLLELELYRNYIPDNAYDSAQILTNLIPFVNDAIGYHMYAEKILYYSDNCYGTADAIIFNEKEKILRIHDLKTGSVPAKIEQLLIYAALFCLEYRIDPYDISCELRIYQNEEVLIHNPEPEEIKKFMDLIKFRNVTIESIKERNYE